MFAKPIGSRMPPGEQATREVLSRMEQIVIALVVQQRFRERREDVLRPHVQWLSANAAIKAVAGDEVTRILRKWQEALDQAPVVP